MADLHALLTQTEGTEVSVYTHGEMLPAHAYPALRAFKSLAGARRACVWGAWGGGRVGGGRAPA